MMHALPLPALAVLQTIGRELPLRACSSHPVHVSVYACLLLSSQSLHMQPVADKAELSSAIITDTLAALPVPPQTVSHVKGPILEVHQVSRQGMVARTT